MNDFLDFLLILIDFEDELLKLLACELFLLHELSQMGNIFSGILIDIVQ